MTPLALAIILGGLFGFALDRVGATNPENIINMLRLTNLYLMRVILFAIGLSATLLFGGVLLGLVDVSHLSIKAAYWGVLLGGGLLGIGFAVAGYCPGTGLTALATGRKDALFFVLGGLLGAFVYMLSYSWVKSTGLLANIAGGKSTTLGLMKNTNIEALTGLSGEWLGLTLGIAFMLIAWALPTKLLNE